VGSASSACRVRNRVFDEESNSATRTRLRSITQEEGVTGERYQGIRDVLKKESFSSANLSGLSTFSHCLKAISKVEQLQCFPKPASLVKAGIDAPSVCVANEETVKAGTDERPILACGDSDAEARDWKK